MLKNLIETSVVMIVAGCIATLMFVILSNLIDVGVIPTGAVCN